MIHQINNPFLYSSGPPPPAPTDPYYDDVALLLHCDGSNGSTTFTDNSKNSFTVTPVGNVQISTSTPKFGTGAALFDGNSDALSVPASNEWAFGYGDFTVEYWIKNAGFPARQNIMGILTTNGWNIVLYDGQLYWQTSYFSANLYNFSNATIMNGSWHHVAHCRNGSSHRVFVDGVLIGTYTDNTNYSVNSTALTIGFESTYGYLNGQLDDIRITKGVARYTAAFTPPTQAFPDSSDGSTNFEFINSAYKSYNVSSVTTPSGILNDDLIIHQRVADFYNSVAATYSFTELYQSLFGSDYKGAWSRVASSLPSSITLPTFSYGSLSFLRKTVAGTPTVTSNTFQWQAGTTTITCPALTGAGMLILIVEAIRPSGFVANHPSGWFLQKYDAIWLGGSYSNYYVYKKPNDGQPVTFTTTSTCDIAATMILVN